MSRLTYRIFTALLLITTIVTTTGSSVSAQTPAQAITVSPASTRLSIDPGAQAEDSFEVINGGTDSYTVKLSVNPYHVTGEQYNPQFTQLPGTVDASQWIRLSTTEAPLAGLKVLSVKYTVTVPENTAPGGYYAVVFAQTTKEESRNGGVIPHNRVGNIIYITVNGEVKTGGDVTGPKIPGFTFSPNVPLTLKVSNTGGVHFETKAGFKVTDLTGKTVYTADIERIILPSTIRDITVNWSASLPIGVYTVERQATVGNETITLDAEKILIISPWFLFCVVIFLISVILLLVMRVRQRKKAK